MSNSNENIASAHESYLLVGEKEGVSADEYILLTEEEDGIVPASSLSELTDEVVSDLPDKFNPDTNNH